MLLPGSGSSCLFAFPVTHCAVLPDAANPGDRDRLAHHAKSDTVTAL
jgi:hypothetical protein